jgi:hypothetical protein
MPVRTNSLRKLIDGTTGQSDPKVSRAELQAKKNLPWPPPCVVVEILIHPEIAQQRPPSGARGRWFISPA